MSAKLIAEYTEKLSRREDETHMSHLTITLNNSTETKIILPRSYQHQLQAMIYHLPSSQYADFLHNTGFSPDANKNTKYKMFTFSRLIPNKRPKQIEENKIELSLPLKLIISTPKEEIAEELQTGALLSDTLRLGNNILHCESVESYFPVVSEEIEVKTLSPILCFTKRSDGYKIYHSPYDNRFGEVINKILKRKYKIITGTEYSGADLKIIPRGRVIGSIDRYYYDPHRFLSTKVWSGSFKLTGSKELAKTALSCGLGELNSSGYGCVIP